MPEKSPILNLPPLNGVQDPAVRSYLEALTHAWAVRNGQTRETDEKFLTVKDLKDGISAASSPGGAGGSSGRRAGGAVVQEVANAIQSLSDAVQQGQLWKMLGERIAQIEMPAWFRNKFGAEIRSEQVKLENATSAMAGELTTAVTNINGNIAVAQGQIQAVSDQAGATASQVTTLQATVNGVSSTASSAFSLASSVNGAVNGAWTVKFDINGYVTGAGLGVQAKGGTATSEFLIRADKFVVGSPSAAGITPVTPFIVTTTPTTINGVAYPPGVWMQTAMIANATIDYAKIRNVLITNGQIDTLAVGTLNIADNAVTVSTYADHFLSPQAVTTTPITTAQTVVVIDGTGGASAGTIIMAHTTFYEGGGSGTTLFTRISVNGVTYREAGCTLGESKTTTIVAQVNLVPGTHTISVSIYCTSSKVLACVSSLVVMSGKR